MPRPHLLSFAVILAILAVNSAKLETNDKNSKLHRPSSWGVMRGTWGKRDWKSARGMWGKREEPDSENEEKRNWSKASGVWGKRAWDEDGDGQSAEEQYDKRGWEKAADTWGKRTGWNRAKGMWGRRKRGAFGSAAVH